MVQLYFFYFFSGITVLSAIFVIFANNPVHSVLWLITSFFGVAGFFILLGAEFLALILMIVYVGALAVLFLFVVMMLNISFSNLRTGLVQYLPFGLLIGMLILAELFIDSILFNLSVNDDELLVELYLLLMLLSIKLFLEENDDEPLLELTNE